jgi:hypothetical protein
MKTTPKQLEVLTKRLSNNKHKHHFNHMFLLWPNTQVMSVNLIRWVGTEVVYPGEKEPLIFRVFSTVGESLERSFRSERNERKWLCVMIRGLIHNGSQVMLLNVRNANGGHWECENEPFETWRPSSPGSLHIGLRHRDITICQARLAELMLTPWDRRILGDDIKFVVPGRKSIA